MLKEMALLSTWHLKTIVAVCLASPKIDLGGV